MLKLVLAFVAVLIGTRAATAQPARLTVTLAPRVAAVQREGLTGGGTPVVSGQRVMLFYPNHPDDFGGSHGTGTSLSEDAGITWKSGQDDWPIVKTLDLWADPLRNGDLLAFGLHWVPDPKQRTVLTAQDVPENAYSIAVSKDGGRTWAQHRATIEQAATQGIIARPLPHILEADDSTLLMPAYAWSKTGHAMLLLHSSDRGRRWAVRSTICSAMTITKLGVAVSTPWLETTVTITADGSLLAAMRTGSNATAAIVSARSSDKGQSWSPPERLLAGPDQRPITGKLPTLARLPSGPLVLLAAHSKNHCRLYVSADGTGREWSAPHIITSQSGGNAGLAILSDDSLLISTPMNGRLNAWRATLHSEPTINAELPIPEDIQWERGTLRWKSMPSAVAYRITPLLMSSQSTSGEFEQAPYASTQTRDATPQLDLSRRLVIGGTYVFEVASVDQQGRLSKPVRSQAFVISQ